VRGGVGIGDLGWWCPAGQVSWPAGLADSAAGRLPAAGGRPAGDRAV